MTNGVDEHLLTAAKLREQIRGDLETHERHYPHSGIVTDKQDRACLSFVEGTISQGGLDVTSFEESELGQAVHGKFTADRTTEAVQHGNGSVMSHLVGVTEQDLDGSSLRLPMMLLDEIENNDAPAFIIGAGNPNTGKTNTMSLLAELRKAQLDEYMIISNVRSWPLTDEIVTSAYDLAVTLLEHRDTPKFVFIDESSTHFDARTYRREVATQWTPLAKRFAKIGVDACGNVIHTGKDAHPELKRMATLAYFKTEKKIAEFYERWPADGDYPTDQLFGGSIEDLEPTGYEADPNDAAPWAWNLEPDLFSKDLRWPDLLDALRARGPAE